MTTPLSLPVRPSLESLRKQAKRLARDIAAGNADAVARARTQLPDAQLPLSHRDAQLVLAREYGYAGWRELTAEVLKRTGHGLDWAVGEAQRVIHDNDVERLKQLLAEYPALLSWRDDRGGLLGRATSSYGDSFDPAREQNFTRRECAEVLIDSGAVVEPSVCERLIGSRTRGLIDLFRSKGLLPRTLRFLAAVGDLDDIRAYLDEHGALPAAMMNDAFMCACHLEHEAVASFLLDRCIELDAELGRQVDEGPGRAAFVRYLSEERSLAFIKAEPAGPWQAFLMNQVVRAIHENDIATFTRLLQRESWMLGEACIGLQVGLVERAVMRDREAFIVKLIELASALVRRRPPPKSQALEFALTGPKAHLVPTLMRVWPMPDELQYAAGSGDFARVKRWFDDAGRFVPAADPHERARDVQWTLDSALAWAVLNRHFEIARFLLEHGADINTRWGSHEAASILHELVFHDNREGMQFLIDHGIDMTIVDYRWGGTAEGWARYGANNEEMGEWLAAAERNRKKDP